MGVHGLWELLTPVGRRVSVETLAGKRLAIDASIWMVQFMRAMRDEKGEMVRDAHLLGFLRRICKLLFLRARPVFVFDGATPPLKRRTLAARRRHRDAAQAKIRKTAEKLLLSHLKARKLEELAAEIRNDRAKHDAKGKQIAVSKAEGSDEANRNENGESNRRADASVDQEKLDELLAASLAAEEEADLAEKGTNPGVSVPLEGGVAEIDDDNDEDDEEMIFPVTTSNIDPSVLASLPPSMQLDLLVQMRESVMAENRQKYQKIKKAPAKFSELQVQSYLKTVAFRREIDEVQRCAAGKGIGGVQTSRIASEANREFIFSSSFTGDKQQILTERAGNDRGADHSTAKKQNSSDLFKMNMPSSSKSSAEAPVSESLKDFGPDVETFCDERGRVRVSRVRAMGIRMTRDIQRNLDFMKEYEREKSGGQINADPGFNSTEEAIHFPEHLFKSNDPPSSFVTNEAYAETIDDNSQGTSLGGGSNDVGAIPFPGSSEPIEISFLEDQSEVKGIDDQIFLHLVSGSSSNLLPNSDQLAKRTEESDDSECIWEEGVVEGENVTEKGNKKACCSSLVGSSYTEDEVDWEEGVCDVPRAPPGGEYNPTKVSKGALEEEALMQEAIRRSLEDFETQKSEKLISENLRASDEDKSSWFDVDIPKPTGNTSETFFPSESDVVKDAVKETGIQINSDRKDVMHDTRLATADKQDDQNVAQPTYSGRESNLNTIYSQKERVRSSNLPISTSGAEPSITSGLKVHDSVEMGHTNNNIPEGPIDGDKIGQQQNINSDRCTGSDRSKCFTADANLSQTSKSTKFSGIMSDDHEKNLMMGDSVVETEIQKENFIKGDENLSSFERGYDATDNMDDDRRVSAASLEKEISLLRQEQLDLGNERRKLESHAESVSSEMFVECQELLQMFGLPYIIAPMEAEAQCAYMEMTNLVDGVVTDDSDVFLFGAKSVYKNIFDDRKYVETYFMKDIESGLGLTREKLIRMALLLGSDYTEGVSGIGIVNAIEVVHAFPEEDGLRKFREWIESPDPAILGKLDLKTSSNSKKKSKPCRNDSDGMRKNPEELESSEARDDQQSCSGNEDIKEIFMSKHRNVSKNWHIPSCFPSDSVISAYISPQVDDSTEPFSWGRPDLSLLRKLCWERFGWSKEKADELLLPVLREYNKHETQLRLEAFYTFNERFAKIRSQRIKKAIKGITGNCFPDRDELVQDSYNTSNTSKKKHAGSSCSRGRGRGKRSAGRRTMGGQDNPKADKPNSSSDEGSHEEDTRTHTSPPETMSLRRSKRQRKEVKYAEEGCEADDLDVPMNQIDGNDLSQAAAGRGLIEKDSRTDQISRDMNDLQSTQVHQDASLVGVSDGNDGDDVGRDVSGFEFHEEDPQVDSSSRDYLFSGGGFCVEESDEQCDATIEPSSTSLEPEMRVASDPAGPVNETPGGVIARCQSLNLPNSGEATENDATAEASRGLRAMPSLKRKRRGGS